MKNQVKIFVVAHKPFGIPEGEALVHGGLARKVKADRIEKFVSPAILLGLKNDGIV